MRYVRQLFKDPSVASIAPSSKRTIRVLCDMIDFDKDIQVVEYGPATGCITRAILERMSPASRIVAFETNQSFVDDLLKIDDPRLTVVKDDARDVMRTVHDSVDYVISGIPFSMIPSPEEIVRNSYGLLKENGHFLVYQVSLRVYQHLNDEFPLVKRRWQPLNIPPLWIFDAMKTGQDQ